PGDRIHRCLRERKASERRPEHAIRFISEEAVGQQLLNTVRKEETVLGSLECRCIEGPAILTARAEAVRSFQERQVVLELHLPVGEELRQRAALSEGESQRIYSSYHRRNTVEAGQLREVSPVAQVAELRLVENSRAERMV